MYTVFMNVFSIRSLVQMITFDGSYGNMGSVAKVEQPKPPVRKS